MRAPNPTCSTLLIIVMGISAIITTARTGKCCEPGDKVARKINGRARLSRSPVLYRHVCTAIRYSICMMSWRPTDRNQVNSGLNWIAMRARETCDKSCLRSSLLLGSRQALHRLS